MGGSAQADPEKPAGDRRQPAQPEEPMSDEHSQFEEEQLSEVDEEPKEPPMYKVLLHNDDYTTKEFVVGILMSVFHKTMEEATALMFYVHENGVGLCGIYPLEVAETKVKTAVGAARDSGFPLQLTIEEE
jgi:ATP-dependent Clp protease adaptor protein ClpS